MDILELLSLANEFEVEKIETNVYKVESRDVNLKAMIVNERVNYYITGVQNNCDDTEEIDLEELDKLKSFCSKIIKLNTK